MKRSFLMICIAVIATSTGCDKSDPTRLEGPQVAQPIEVEPQRRNDPSLIPYTVIQSSEVLHYKKSYDVQVDLVDGRLPTESELADISNSLRASAGPHEKTFVVFYLPGMKVDNGGFATAHHEPDLSIKLLRFNVPERYRRLLPPEDIPLAVVEPLVFSSEPLDVEFEITTEWVDNRLVMVGSTNLPDNTEIMGSVIRDEPRFIAQSKTKVKDGHFQLGPFGPEYGLPAGTYEVSATMPVARMQPETVRAIIGVDGKNLSGKHVSKNRMFGKCVDFETTVRKK